MIKLFAGLGNPGPDYAGTRHNAGFWWVDTLASKLNASFTAEKAHQAQVARVVVDGQPRWLIKPQAFMNLSGRSVASLARFFKIAPDEILVAYDELDLPPGEVKLKFGTNRSTHNGLRDMYDQLGTGDYWRLRLGIGHPGDKNEVSSWVLKKPSLDHKIAMEQAIDRSLKGLDQFLTGDMQAATLLVHTKTAPRPRPPRPSNPVQAESTDLNLPKPNPQKAP